MWRERGIVSVERERGIVSVEREGDRQCGERGR